jgi:hypothetical protein
MYKQKKSPPNHFIGATSSNKMKASIINLLFALEIYLCDFNLLLPKFKKCKGVLIAFLHFTFLKQFKPVKDDSTHLKFHKTMTFPEFCNKILHCLLVKKQHKKF